MTDGHNDLVSPRARSRRRIIGTVVVVFLLLLLFELAELIHLRP